MAILQYLLKISVSVYHIVGTVGKQTEDWKMSVDGS